MDRLDVGNRIDLAGDMHDVRILEASHHVRDRVALADVGEELIAQAFALRGTRHQSRDIDELDRRSDHLLRLGDGGELCEPRVGHLDDADVGVDGAERIVLRRDPRLGEGVE